MSRRFSNEPINVIRRIPSPEQLDAARPVKRPLGKKFGKTAASLARSVGELLGHIRSQRTIAGLSEPHAALQDGMEESPTGISEVICESSDQAVRVVAPRLAMPRETAHPESKPYQVNHVPDAPPSIHPDELAELRGYLLKHQQDIVRLTARIQELTSLVMSQQHVIEYLGKEMGIVPESCCAGGVASAIAKQNTSCRPGPMTNEKEVGSEGDPIRLPVSLSPSNKTSPDFQPSSA